MAVKRFIPALLKSRYANLYMIGSRDLNKANKIANQYNCNNYGTYKDILYNKEVDVVYISTPITSLICFFTFSTSEAGKSILFKTGIMV